MASMEDTPLEELLNEATDMDSDETKSGSGLPKKAIVFAGLIIAAVCAAYGVASVIGGGEATASDQKAEKLVADIEETPAPAPRRNQPLLYTPESIIVNLHGTEARRYLKVNLSLSMRDDRALQQVQTQRVRVIDRLIVLLSSKTIDDIDGYEKKNALKEQICVEINKLLSSPDAVLDVYFSELIIQ